MKDERIHHGAVDKSKLEQQICVKRIDILCCEKNWPYPTASGSYGRQAGR